MSAHTFVESSFTRSTFCNYCLKFIWGIRKQGFRCAECGYACHAKCQPLVPANCSRVPHKKLRHLRRTERIEDLDDIERAMRKPNSGLAILDRKVLLKTHAETFVASELVDWILTNLPVRSREDAVLVGQKLADVHRIEHSNGKKEKPTFHDDNGLWRFVSEETITVAAAAAAAESVNDDDGENDDTEITVTDFELLKVVGKGGFGKVLKVRKKDSGKIYAMKVMDKSLFKNEKHIEALMAERDIMLNDSVFLVHLYFSFQTEDKLYFVMDFVGGGDLAFYFDKFRKFPPDIVRFVGAETILGLEFLHSCGVIYRDLKPENILIDTEGHVVLTDFGLSKLVGESVRTLTVWAPEVVKIAVGEALHTETKPYDNRVDIWSLGVVLYEMFVGSNPFDGENFAAMAQRVLNVNLSYTQPVFTAQPEAAALLRKLIQRDPAARPTFSQMKNDPWFAGLSWKDLAVKRIPSPLKVAVGDNFERLGISVEEVVGKSSTIHDERFGHLEYSAPKIIENPLSNGNDASIHKKSSKSAGLHIGDRKPATIDANLDMSMMSVPNSLQSSLDDHLPASPGSSGSK